MLLESTLGVATRAYLIHLIGYTHFVDKSATSISVSYFPLFRDLAMCGGYAWGATALAYMYDKLEMFLLLGPNNWAFL